MSKYAYAALVALLGLLLVASHWKVYHLGRTLKQAEFNQAVAAATERAREREQALVKAKNESEVRYAQLKKRNETDAVGTRSALDSLRQELALSGAAPSDAPTSPGAYGTGGLERELLGHCAATLASLAAEADRLEAKVIGLQGYVKNVCMSK